LRKLEKQRPELFRRIEAKRKAKKKLVRGSWFRNADGVRRDLKY